MKQYSVFCWDGNHRCAVLPLSKLNFVACSLEIYAGKQCGGRSGTAVLVLSGNLVGAVFKFLWRVFLLQLTFMPLVSSSCFSNWYSCHLLAGDGCLEQLWSASFTLVIWKRGMCLCVFVNN